MTLLGRESPELPSDVRFTDLEIEVLRRHAEKPPVSVRFCRRPP